MKIHLDEIGDMTHDEMATRTYRMALAAGDPVLLALAVQLRDAVDTERDSDAAAQGIREYLERLK